MSHFAFSNARASMGSSGVSFACHAVAFAFAITTANFDEIEDKHQKLWCVKGLGSMH